MNQKVKAAGFVMAAVLVATIQDAIVKYLQEGYPTWEAVAFRGLLATPFFIAWAKVKGVRLWYWPDQAWLIVLRSIILFTGYLAFALSLATLPMADAAVIYFTMPFIVALLSAPLLKEHVPAHRWIAIIIGFGGVVVASNPGAAFQPAALLALYAAFAYAMGALILRKSTHVAEHLYVANVQSQLYLLGSLVLGLIMWFIGKTSSDNAALAALSLPFAWPNLIDFGWMALMGFTSCISSVCFVRAYFLAPANFVAPFEYSALFWSIIFGFSVFGDLPTRAVILGALIVVCAGLFMAAYDRRYSSDTRPNG